MNKFLLNSTVMIAAIAIAMAIPSSAFPQDNESPKNKNPKLPSGWRVNDLERPQPTVVTPGKTDSAPPSDAIVLFDGTDLSAWNGSKVSNSKNENPDGQPRWKVENGYMEITPTGGLSSKQKFGDMQLHIEFATPENPTDTAQRRGNSGVFLMGRYEIQIMDAFENTAYADGMAGAVYGQSPPLVNISRKPGQWQSFDILFTAPRFKGEELLSPARVTVLQNGVLVQLNTEILGPTRHQKTLPYKPHGAKQPIGLQNHGQSVRFRNIWVRNLNSPPPKPIMN